MLEREVPRSREHPIDRFGDPRMRIPVAFTCCALAVLAAAAPSLRLAGSPVRVEAASAPGELAGEVLDAAGGAVAGAEVVATPAGRALRFATRSDARGRFSLRGVPAGACTLVARAADGRASAPVATRPGAPLRLALGATPAADAGHSSAAWLATLPEGVEKRRFILDCTGCHQFNETRVFASGALRSRAQWQGDVERMLRYAGANSGFPVIGAGRDPERTAAWLAQSLGAEPGSRAASAARRGAAIDFAPAELLEVDMPVPQDLPHDVAIERGGHVLVTGMFTHVLQRFDPASLALEAIELPVPRANPRAVEIDDRGNAWVLFGQPRVMARREAGTGAWKTWPIGHYPHSIAPEPGGKGVWFNGHFTRDPEIIGRLDPASGRVDSFVVPRHPTLGDSGGPVPYELRLAPDGAVWMSELQGNRVVRVDRGGTIKLYELPEPWSGPRRLDVDANGIVWIPAYSGGALWRLDPASGEFRRHALPIPDSAPYVCRVHPKTGEVWIGTAAADAVFRFDPRRGTFRSYALATRGATVRHMAVDAERNEVWLALGASPAIHPARVVRLRPRD